jgi:Predicted transcriptional regulator
MKNRKAPTNMISERTWKSLRVMAILYQLDNGLPVSSTTFCRHTKLSRSYLEQILSQLRKAGFVLSIKGPGGGYLLAQKDISVTDILRVTETMADDVFFEPVLHALSNVSIASLAAQLAPSISNNDTYRRFTLIST